MERQLRAILAMDVVGFSKMMAEDEERTLRVLTSRREVVDNYRGYFQSPLTQPSQKNLLRTI